MCASASGFIACVAEDGSAWVWGRELCRFFGRWTPANSTEGAEPLRLTRDLWGGSPAVMVACGRSHLLLLTAAGRVWSCGSATCGQLGHGDSPDATPRMMLQTLTVLPLTSAVSGECRGAMVAAGMDNSVVIGTEGQIWTWGKHVAELPPVSGDLMTRTTVPKQLDTGFLHRDTPLVVAAGDNMTMIVTTAGDLWGWGYIDDVDMCIPTRLGARDSLGGSKALSVACGVNYVLVVTHQGALWALRDRHDWNREDFGDGPKIVPTRIGIEPRCVSVGANHANMWATTEHGDLYTWRRPTAGDDEIIERVTDAQLHGQRFGRFQNMSIPRTLAFAMGTHARLGGQQDAPTPQRSPHCEATSDVLFTIVQTCIEQPSGPVVKFKGIMRALGCGLTLLDRRSVPPLDSAAEPLRAAGSRRSLRLQGRSPAE